MNTMKTIHKVILEVQDDQWVQISANAEILSVQNQSGNICMWYECDPSETQQAVHIKMYGTGHFISDVEQQYLGTVLNAPFVWHIYLVK